MEWGTSSSEYNNLWVLITQVGYVHIEQLRGIPVASHNVYQLTSHQPFNDCVTIFSIPVVA